MLKQLYGYQSYVSSRVPSPNFEVSQVHEIYLYCNLLYQIDVTFRLYLHYVLRYYIDSPTNYQPANTNEYSIHLILKLYFSGVYKKRGTNFLSKNELSPIAP